MVGTIRRAFDLTGGSRQGTQNTQAAAAAGAAAPPSYQAATAPSASSSGGSIPASAFQRQSSTGTNTRPYSVASPQTSSGTGRPLGQVPAQQRPVSYAQPSGAPPGHQMPPSKQQQQQPQQAFQQAPQGGSSSTSTGAGASLNRSNTQEDRMAVLRRYDTCILIDDSASMYNLWREAEAALAGIVEQVIKYDTDGLDVYFLNSQHALQGAKDAGSIRELFQYVGPVGESTPTEIRVEELLSPYVEQCERAKKTGQTMPKPLNLLVLTDGESDDPDTLAYTLQGFAQRLDEIRAPLTQLGVQFVQIGNDPSATEALKQLDDELQGCRDMVDTTPYQGAISADFLVKVALGSINRRIDRSG